MKPGLFLFFLFLTCALLLPAAATAQDSKAAATRAAKDCDRVAAALKLTQAKVNAAHAVTEGQFTPPAAAGADAPQAITGLPAFCRVQLTLTPSADSDIKSEVWMPLRDWNGRFQQVGNGAWAGSIQYGALADALKRGYAASSTDAGHTGTDASFAVGHPEKLKDFGYRAVHETAVQSKQTITNFYGMAPRMSYFNGCSGGGRMAFQEMQRFPADFDAILAGAPGYDRVNQSVQMLMNAKATLDNPASMIPASKYPVIHRAALDACDAQDGLKDGLISEPLSCRFDPVVTQCKSGDAPTCLTAPQVEAARRIYAGVKNPKTGESIFPGLEPGSELNWSGPAGGPEPLAVGADLFKYVVFKDPKWDFRKFDLARDYDAVHRIDSLDLSPTSPDIKAFVARGGKLLIYQGWGDMNVAPKSTVAYYDNVVKTIGQKQADDSVRLYFAPGMAHCGGGEGPNTFDALTPLEQWREQGKAPASIVATHWTFGKLDRSRPLCPYPQVAKYIGGAAGDVADAAYFVCGAPIGNHGAAAK
ncbi:MAG TPA: tannase/feruloyl esterase family alpha/beta hydrolase [Vicinamibacterales bacterium]|jgi:feruloyl esterase|nr:tannase/feruloyl esterase family alpha/beta hydrolase [Vicinamibacterales bacterium]